MNSINCNKKRRSENWESDEKKLLLQCIKKKITIIENKVANTNTNALKKQAWNEIYQSFNILNKRRREMSQIKTLWKNYKTKRRCSQFKRQLNLTSDEPRPHSHEVSDTTPTIPPELQRDFNIYDSDGIYHLMKLKEKNEIKKEQIGKMRRI